MHSMTCARCLALVLQTQGGRAEVVAPAAAIRRDLVRPKLIVLRPGSKPGSPGRLFRRNTPTVPQFQERAAADEPPGDCRGVAGGVFSTWCSVRESAARRRVEAALSDQSTRAEESSAVGERPVAKLDLSKYQTSELVAQITELISIPSMFGRVILTTFLFALLVVFTCAVIFFYSQLSGVGWVLGCAYALVLGFLFGVLLGVLRAVSKALGNIEAILSLVLTIAKSAAEDYDRLQTGTARMPTGGELVEQVYEEVLLPSLEQAVAGAFWILSRPLLWIYRRTIGRSVRWMIKWCDQQPLTDEQSQQVRQHAEAGLSAVASYSQTIQQYASTAAQYVAGVGRGIRAYAMRPLYIAFTISLSTASLPLLLLRWFVTE